MKKIAFLLVFFSLLPFNSDGRTDFLKMRSNHHPGFLRIVLEGPEDLINKAIVNQKAQSVMVAFPDSNFSIEEEKAVLAYRKTDKDTIMFFPGSFRGLKVFNLKHPARLIVDIYKDRSSGEIVSPVLPRKRREKAGVLKGRTVIIDAGHGGFESGLIKDNYREKNVVMDIAKKMHLLINRGSSTGLLTRASDRYMGQGERVRFANSQNADIYISLHIGSHAGIVIYVPVITEQVSDTVKPYLYNTGQEEYLNETVTLLNAMKEAVATDLGKDMVSVQPYPYSFIAKIEAAALMIELPSFEDAYYIEELKTEMANTLYKGLYIYEEIHAK